MRFLPLLAWVLTVPAFSAPILARVNGVAIHANDLEERENRGESRKAALDKLILFQLAVQDAKAKKLDQDPDMQREIDKIYYKAFLKAKLSDADDKLKPTSEELQAAYEAAPLVRARHLLLWSRNPKEAATAEKMIAAIKKEMKEGKNFRDIVIKYSQDDSGRWGGDLDFRGVNSLPEGFYKIATKLKKNELSQPFKTEGATQLLFLLDRKSFDQANAAYLQYLENRIKSEREDKYLASALSDLKKKAKIEIMGVSE